MPIRSQLRARAKNGLVFGLIAFAVILTIYIIGAILAADDSSRSTQQQSGSATSKADSATQMPEKSAKAAAPTIFPVLHFTSSGRLPTKFHGIEIGMSANQVLAINPDLKYCLNTSDHDPNATLCSPLDRSGGFSQMLSFSDGRLFEISSDVDSIRPEDAEQFNQNMLNQLGKPDVSIYGGPSKYIRVWIDGDVRIRYSDSAPNGSLFGSNGTQTVSMDMVVFPVVMDAVRNSTSNDMSKADELTTAKNYWGDNASQPVFKQLPRGLPNLTLLMTPWQVRLAVPGIEIDTTSEHEANGKLETPRVDTSVAFWNGRTMAISRWWYRVPPDQFAKLHDQLIQTYGTSTAWMPTINGATNESFTWEDNTTKIDYVLNRKGRYGQPEVDAWFRDLQLSASKAADEMAANPPKFKAAPAIHSFF